MKKILILFSLLLAPYLQAQWIYQNSGTIEQLNDVYCITADTVVVVGNNATILRTTDGGTTWNAISNPATGNLTRVQFADNQTGYATSDNGILLKTTDGGLTWQSLNAGFSDLSCIDANTLYACDNNSIQKSTDGGNTWTLENTVATLHFVEIQMFDTSQGYAIAVNDQFNHSYLFKKDANTNQWTQVYDIGNTFYDPTLFFINQDEGIFTNGDVGVTIYQQNNYFGTAVNLSPIRDLYANDLQHFWIIGAAYVSRSNNSISDGYIYKQTFDNNSNLISEERVTIYNHEINTIDFFDDQIAYVVGNEGIILKNSTGINTVGIEQNIKNPFQIYPNPVTNYIHIRWEENNTKPVQYQITNLQGQVLQDYKDLKNNSILVEDLPQGFYLLQLQIGNKLYKQKFIKE